MDYNNIRDAMMDMAKEKGFGTKPDDILVPEKMALIHSEISEAYSAFLEGNMNGKDGFFEELGDVVQRTLHLGGVFNIDFTYATNGPKGALVEKEMYGTHIALLHKVTSTAFSAWRKQDLHGFKTGLVQLAYLTNEVGLAHGEDLESHIMKKLDYNKDRVWNWEKLNETAGSTQK